MGRTWFFLCTAVRGVVDWPLIKDRNAKKTLKAYDVASNAPRIKHALVFYESKYARPLAASVTTICAVPSGVPVLSANEVSLHWTLDLRSSGELQPRLIAPASLLFGTHSLAVSRSDLGSSAISAPSAGGAPGSLEVSRPLSAGHTGQTRSDGPGQRGQRRRVRSDGVEVGLI